MTKAKKKEYTLADFMTKDLNETATKMPLLFDGKDTGCYLMVMGIESKSVQRARIVAQVQYADMAEDAEKIADKVDRALFEKEKKEQIEVGLALELIAGWSFEDQTEEFNYQSLLSQNQGIALGVIAHAATPQNYLLK